MALTLGNACRCHSSTVHLAARSFAALPSGRFGAVALLYTAKCSWITDNCGASGQGSHSAAFIAAELVYGDQEMLAAAQLSRASRKPFALEQSKPHPVTIIACLCTNEHRPPRSPRAHVFTRCGLAQRPHQLTGVTLSVMSPGTFPTAFVTLRRRSASVRVLPMQYFVPTDSQRVVQVELSKSLHSALKTLARQSRGVSQGAQSQRSPSQHLRAFSDLHTACLVHHSAS